MARMEKFIEIKAPPGKVWKILALDKAVEWMDEMEWERAEYTTEVRTPEDKYRVGATAHITEKRWDYDLEILESLENEKMKVHSIGKYAYTFTFTLRPVDGGTMLTLEAFLKMPYGILGEFLYKLASGSGEKQVQRALDKLKNIVEE